MTLIGGLFDISTITCVSFSTRIAVIIIVGILNLLVIPHLVYKDVERIAKNIAGIRPTVILIVHIVAHASTVVSVSTILVLLAVVLFILGMMIVCPLLVFLTLWLVFFSSSW